MSEKVLMNDADDQQKSHQQEWPLCFFFFTPPQKFLYMKSKSRVATDFPPIMDSVEKQYKIKMRILN